jgi:hypothetical protein
VCEFFFGKYVPQSDLSVKDKPITGTLDCQRYFADDFLEELHDHEFADIGQHDAETRVCEGQPGEHRVQCATQRGYGRQRASEVDYCLRFRIDSWIRIPMVVRRPDRTEVLRMSKVFASMLIGSMLFVEIH